MLLAEHMKNWAQATQNIIARSGVTRLSARVGAMIDDQLYSTTRVDPTNLLHLEKVLNRINASIKQVSNKKARVLTSTVIAKLTAAIASGGTASLISAVGTASTGTAIGGLSGAAATTATLYWAGSIIGLGTVAGGVMLGSAGVGVGVASAFIGKRMVFGKNREEDNLQDYERAIVSACFMLISEIRSGQEQGAIVTKEEAKIVATKALVPLSDTINRYLNDENMHAAGVTERSSFQSCLKYWYWQKLKTAVDDLEKYTFGALK